MWVPTGQGQRDRRTDRRIDLYSREKKLRRGTLIQNRLFFHQEMSHPKNCAAITNSRYIIFPMGFFCPMKDVVSQRQYLPCHPSFNLLLLS